MKRKVVFKINETIIELLKNITFFSTLIGAVVGSIIGGLISWINIRYSINKEIEIKKNEKEMNNKIQIRNAYISILNELNFNINHLKEIKVILDRNNVNSVKLPYTNSNISMEKWKSNSDILLMLGEEVSKELELFYFNITNEINTNTYLISRLNTSITNGLNEKINIEKKIEEINVSINKDKKQLNF